MLLMVQQKLLLKSDMSLANCAVNSIAETAVDAMQMIIFLPDFTLMCHTLVMSSRGHAPATLCIACWRSHQACFPTTFATYLHGVSFAEAKFRYHLFVILLPFFLKLFFFERSFIDIVFCFPHTFFGANCIMLENILSTAAICCSAHLTVVASSSWVKVSPDLPPSAFCASRW